MEKIKQALEKARQQREQSEAGGAAQARVPPADVPTQSHITYTQTRTVDGSNEQMRESRLVSSMEPCKYTDALKILSTQTLQRMSENGWTTVMVSSPRESEGKTTTAINLGLSIAREVDYTVMVVDACLRHPGIHQFFGIDPARGLSDYLSSDLELSEILINPKGISHFVLLPGGTPSISSAELLGSPRMQALVDDLKSRYERRMIIFDVPSVLDTADALALAPLVDSALLVVEDDVTSENDLKASIDTLSTTNIIGTVLNKSIYR